MPLHRAMASHKFLEDVFSYGGIAEILLIGTGTAVGFPFGHALAAVHYKKNHTDCTKWATLNPIRNPQSPIPNQRSSL
jgi:hypothetical protein